MDKEFKQRKISLNEMAPHVHSFSYGENKVDKISYWMLGWINENLKTGKIQPYDFLPTKAELAFHIGVSLGTIQCVYRFLEDNGVIESKQRIGSYIKNQFEKQGAHKLTSKRELTCEIIKDYLIKNRYKKNDILPSIRKLSEQINIPAPTVRTALNTLISEKFLYKDKNNFFVEKTAKSDKSLKTESLVEKISLLIKNYIELNLKEGQKIPSNKDFAKMYKVSVKTVYEAIRLLSEQGILQTRRGKYGTVVVSNGTGYQEYFYQTVENNIRKYISANCKEGAKLPSIKEFSAYYKVSTKTVKNALDNIAQDGYIAFTRGRRGGTFVIEVPNEGENYTWLALNPNYVSEDN